MAGKNESIGAERLFHCKQRPPLLMKIDEDAVSIKATTSEQMGYVGREEGVSASAVVLIFKD